MKFLRPRDVGCQLVTVALLLSFCWYSGYIEFRANPPEYREWYNHQAHWGQADSLDHILSGALDFNSTARRPACDIRNLPPIDPDDTAPCSRSTFVRTINNILDSNLNDYLSSSAVVQDRARASLTRLRNCIQDSSGCKPEVFKVIVSTYSWFTKSYFWDGTDTITGEVVWTQSLVEALDRAGFTVIVPPFYDGMVRLHRDMGDLITMIWLQDVDGISCQMDPYCVANMTPTYQRYPGLEEAIHNGSFTRHESVHKDKQSSKWLWTQEELDAIPKDQRGTIPLHKIFVPTVWGAKPGEGGLAIPTHGRFSFNPLGTEWVIAPFRYPLHTWIPFSLEAKCMAISEQKKEDSIFILGKRVSFFYSDLAPNPKEWIDVATKVGLRLIAAASPDKDDTRPLPDGVERVGPFNPASFNEALGKSRAMVAIGNPFISPSPFDAICQGTPVLIPTYYDFPHDFVWDAFTTYSQNYPVLQLGEPYAYGYRWNNHTDLLDKLQTALKNPIPRYIPPEQTMVGLQERLRWFLHFDWEALGRHRVDYGKPQFPLYQVEVMARCYELGHCVNLKDFKV